MELFYNKQEVQTLIQDLHNLTGATVTFYDSDLKTLEYSRRKTSKCNYCSFIQKDSRLANACQLSDELHFATSNTAEQYYIYTCHAGLIEIIVPIYDNNIKLGTIIIGKLRDKEMKFSSPQRIKKFIKTHKLDSKLLDYYYSQPCLSHEEIKSLINIALSVFQNIVNKQLIKNKTDILFNEITTYISQNINESITIEMLCKRFATNKNTLYKVFKNNSGKTVMDYIIHQRINHAAHLLSTTNLPIKEIAFMVGFSECNYFMSVFKKIIHLSPLKYRKKFLPNSTLSTIDE